jgi:hypothetical protein
MLDKRSMVGFLVPSPRPRVEDVLMKFTLCRTSLTYGHPYMIDVRDCDARLPSSGDADDLYMDELVRISVVLGKVLKTIYRYGSGCICQFFLIKLTCHLLAHQA